MGMSLEQAMQMAIGHHQAGRLSEAETVCRQILAQFPKHAQALHFLGILAGEAGNPEVGIDLIGRAIAVNPSIAEYHSDLGHAYCASGHWDRAIASLRRAIELKPKLALAHNNLGNALRAAGRLDEAIAAFRSAIGLERSNAVFHDNLGNAAD